MNILKNNELPMGLSMALAENLRAMQKFSNMSEEEQRAFFERSKNAESKQEMQALVLGLERMD